jgi:hypothetical protein
MSKYKINEEKLGEHDVPVYLQCIANELAEQNRLKRLQLEMKFRTQANRSLYRTYKGKDGETFTVPPDEKQKKEWKEEIEAIKKELEDQA